MKVTKVINNAIPAYWDEIAVVIAGAIIGNIGKGESLEGITPNLQEAINPLQPEASQQAAALPQSTSDVELLLNPSIANGSEVHLPEPMNN